MPKFAANLHYMFAEMPFFDRFKAAAAAGFRAVEFQVPYDWPKHLLVEVIQESDVEVVLIDSPVGDWHQGGRGMAAVPGREAEFRDSLGPAIEYAKALGCNTVNLLAGVPGPGVPAQAAETTFIENLKHAVREFQSAELNAVIEPINGALGRTDGYVTAGMPGYFLNRVDHARAIIDTIGASNLYMQFDCYHRQIVEGNIASALRQHVGVIGHVQFAGVPGRHEPDIGEIHYPYLFALFDELGYPGWLGCEYIPANGTLSGLGWAAEYGIGQAAEQENQRGNG